MGREYVSREELPVKMACPKCGGRRLRIYGVRKVEYEEELDDEGHLLWETGIEWDFVYGVECMDCGNEGDAEEAVEWVFEGQEAS